MAVRPNPHLHLRDQAREALTSYGEVLGGEPRFSTSADMGASDDPDEVDKVRSTGCWTPATAWSWEHLSATGEVIMPLGIAPWGATFGMCTDRFGVAWMTTSGDAVCRGPWRTSRQRSAGAARVGAGGASMTWASSSTFRIRAHAEVVR